MAQQFDEVQFPTAVAFETTGGPTRSTLVVIMGSGAEARNARWLNSRRTYDIVYGVHSMDEIHSVIEFFEARNGKLIGFRFKDWSDYKSCPPDQKVSNLDQEIGVGVGVTSPTIDQFQLIKNYGSGPSNYARPIYKPVAGTVVIAVDGVAMPTGWTVNFTTGLVTFDTPPSSGAVITAGYEFDTPVRFDTDQLSINLKTPDGGILQSLPLMELLLGA